MSGDAYAGVRRKKQTPWTVKFGDAFVSRLIAVGGIGTIAAIMLVVLVLLATAWPLLLPTRVDAWKTARVPATNWRHFALDDQAFLVWGIDGQGTIRVYALEEQQLLAEFAHPDGDRNLTITASSLSINQRFVAVGFSDGSYQTVELQINSAIVPIESLPSSATESGTGAISASLRTVYRRFDAQSLLSVSVEPPRWSKRVSAGSAAVSAIDFVPPDNSNQFAQSSESKLALVVGDELLVATILQRKNLLTDEITEDLATVKVPLISRTSDARPLGLAILNRGTQAVVVWPAGTLDRYNLEEGNPKLVESTNGMPGGGEFTCLAPLLARQTLLCGDAAGTLSGWMIVRPQATKDTRPSLAADGYQLLSAHVMKLGSEPLRSIDSSQRNHAALALAANGQLSLVYITTDDLLHTTSCPFSSDLRRAILAPKGDFVAAISSSDVVFAELRLSYPEASWKGLFGRVWYESYDEPKYVWQSSSGTEMAETKLSLMPLVFGTLKATVYAMLISVPLAILAAIYTSEFFSPRARGTIKPVIEMMASLPSVVLGFIAALVLAPLMKVHLCAVLLSLFVIPLTFLLAAHLWNLLPVDWIIRFQSIRFWLLLLTLPLGLVTVALVAPPIERWLFEGDTSQWLSAKRGSSVGGWMLLLVPILAMLSAMICFGPLANYTRRIAGQSSPRRFAVLMLVRLLLVTSVVVFAAWILGSALEALELDPRNLFFGDYKDRNAILVGAVLGFCIIPIIYTIADDALQAVPQQLRSASLGCGATPWQTTIRIVVPTAMSGLFSAVMIGLGRAVGETMVVLMAAGNTAVMEWNPFSGFRTLSATLATELPEAAKGSTHYRTLFLAALLLFFLTLVVNTIAEFVRIRFRRRASQL